MKKYLILTLLLILIASNISFCSDKDNQKKYKILILWNYQGEYEWAKRIQLACKKLGFDAQLSLSTIKTIKTFEEKVQEEIKLTYPPQFMIDHFKPDFTISLKDDKTFSSSIPNYLVLDVMFEGFFAKNLLRFDGFLHCFSASFFLKPFIESRGKKFHGINWYPSCLATEYQETEPRRLFFCGFLWDEKRNSDDYKTLFTLLDVWDYLSVFGPQDKFEFVTHSYKGLLPFDGKSVCTAIKDAGISLILHSYYHLISGAPTARIFEAASACSVIISDKHPFIMQEFGDSVLYIDDTKSGEEMFIQIRNYMEWIFSHPQEARAKAKKAHAIFIDKFTLERQILNLIAMHEELMQEKSSII